MMRTEGETTYVVSATPKSYGSIREARRSCSYVEAAREDDDFAPSVSNERSRDDMRTTFLRKGIVATAMMMFFGVVVTLAQSKWAKSSLLPGEGARSGLRDLPGATLERTPGTPPVGLLTLEAMNEYGPNDHYTLALYELEMVIEPYRDTTLFVEHSSALGGVPDGASFHWLLISSSEDGVPVEEAEPVMNSFGGSEVVVNVEETGNYFLLVRQFRPDGLVVAEGQVAVSCKYVRREIRQLTDDDREAYFEAMEIVYKTPTEEGRRLYGEAFNNYVVMVGYHNSMNFCYHVGMQFFTSHAAFDLLMERSLQQVNPKVSLAFWDFMLDSGTLGTEWTKSDIFRPDWFGSAHGDPDEHYQLKHGRFANISNVYDPDNDLMDPSISPAHNPYGFIYDRFDYTQASSVVRSHSFCGMAGEFTFPMCDTLVGCFEYGNFSDWSSCMESYVHATAHGMIGGGHRCNVDMEEYLSRHPEYGRGLLTFALEFLTIIEWPSNSLMSDYNSCNTTCSIGETCGCECTANVFNWTEHETRSVWNFPLDTMDTRYGGEAYVDYNTSYTWPLGFMQDGVRLSEDHTTELLRQLAFIGCQPGSIGGMSSGAAPLDPLFWVVHPIFEKSLHVLQLAPQYRDTVNFTWVDSDCTGSAYTDYLPFTEKLLGFGSGTDFLTNAELLEYLHPMLDKTNYIYDDFTTWGTCTDWDPCPSCSMAALERMESRTSREKGDKGHKGPSKPGMRASNSRS